MGLIEDSLYISMALFAAAVTLVLGFYAVSQVAGIPIFAGPTATAVVNNFKFLDGVMLLAVIGFCLASVVLAYFIPSSPVFFFTFIIVAVLTFVITPIYTNAYSALAANTTIGDTFASFPATNAIMTNLPLLSFVISALIAVVTYAKPFSASQELG